MKGIFCVACLSAFLALGACGGGGSGGSSSEDLGSTASGDSGNSAGEDSGDSPGGLSLLTSLLTTGNDSTDTSTQWNCDGNNGVEPVSFAQRFFADGNGQVQDSGLVAAFTWTASSDTSIAVSFPANGDLPAESFSLTDLTFSTVNTASDSYDAIDSRNGTALSCSKSQVSTNPPASPPTLEEQLTLAPTLIENSRFWECGDSDFIFLGDASVVVLNNSGDFTRQWEITAANTLLVTGAGGIAWNQIDFTSQTSFTAVDFVTNTPVSCEVRDLVDDQPLVATCPAFVVDDFNEVESHEFFPENPQGSPASLTGSVTNDLSAFCQSSDTFIADGGQVFTAEGVIRNGGGLGPDGSVEGTFIYAFTRRVTGDFVDGSQDSEIGNEQLIGSFEEAQACSRELLGCSNF